MSNLATAPALLRAEQTSAAVAMPQLPVRAYFDPDVYAAEVRALFAQGPGYVGHVLMVPEAGDYHVLDGRGDGQVLVRADEGRDGVALLSNVCRHRQAVMLNGRGKTERIVWPLQRGTYDL